MIFIKCSAEYNRVFQKVYCGVVRQSFQLHQNIIVLIRVLMNHFFTINVLYYVKSNFHIYILYDLNSLSGDSFVTLCMLFFKDGPVKNYIGWIIFKKVILCSILLAYCIMSYWTSCVNDLDVKFCHHLLTQMKFLKEDLIFFSKHMLIFY